MMTGSDKLKAYAYKVGGGYFEKFDNIETLSYFPISYFKITVRFKECQLLDGYGKYTNKKLLKNVNATKGNKRDLNQILRAIKIKNRLYKVIGSNIDNRIGNICSYSFLLEEVYKDK